MSSILVWLPHGSFYNVTLAHPCPNTAAEKMLMQSNSEELSEGHGEPREPGVDVPFIEAAGDSSFGFRFNLGLDISGCCSNSRYINRLSFCPSLSLGCASFVLASILFLVLTSNLERTILTNLFCVSGLSNDFSEQKRLHTRYNYITVPSSLVSSPTTSVADFSTVLCIILLLPGASMAPVWMASSPASLIISSQ